MTHALLVLLLLPAAQDPGAVAKALQPSGEAARPGEAPAPPPDDVVSPSVTTIDVNESLDPERVRRFLEHTLAKYQGVHEIRAEVEDKVVTLHGLVETEAVRDRLREVALRVEGVAIVVNRVKTVDQVLSAEQRTLRRLATFGTWFARNWLLLILAVATFIGSLALARFVGRSSPWLFRPFSASPLVRSVLGSVVSLAVALAGLYAALQVFGVAQAVLSVVGIAGVAALALGFAFRDIAENFIASILLALRHPFRVGDMVRVAGHTGVVRSLNTRATVLVTLDGHHVRIPNATVFKEVQVNLSTSPLVRTTLELPIAPDVSTARAIELGTAALARHEEIADDPPPRGLLLALEPGSARLRFEYWVPSRGVDADRIASDARLAAKGALQGAGIAVAPPVRVLAEPTAGSGPNDPRHDRHAAERAARRHEAAEDPGKQVLDMAHDSRTSEGRNLLNGNPEEADAEGAAGAPAART
jgi:small-conductance mechanosensitive channel